MSEVFDVILMPGLKDGADPATVTARLSSALKIDEARAEALLAGTQPRRLLRNLPRDQADKFCKLVMACGARCNVAPGSGTSALSAGAGAGAEEGAGAGAEAGASNGLSLVPMSAAASSFKCPSCEERFDLKKDQVIERCPACGIHVQKFLEKQQRLEEKEKIRVRLEAEKARKQKEFEAKLRAQIEQEMREEMERELRKKLGLTKSTGFWPLFMRNKTMMGVAILGSVVGLTVAVTLAAEAYFEEQEYEALLAAEPTPQMTNIATTVAAAATVSDPGTQQTVQEMAQVSNAMAGEPPVDIAQMAIAGQAMMKGIDPQVFMAMAATTQVLGNTMAPLAAMAGMPVGGGSAGMVAMAGMSGAPPMMMGMPGMGNQLGIPGVGQFTREDFAAIAPGLAGAGAGQQAAFGMISGNPILLANMPQVMGIATDRLDALAPAEAATLVKELAVDPEWGRYLAARMDALARQDPDRASALVEFIPTEFERAAARARIAVVLQEGGMDAAARLMAERAYDELENIDDVDSRAQAAVALGGLLAQAGNEIVDLDMRERLKKELATTMDAESRAAILGRLAVSSYTAGEIDVASEQMDEAVAAAGSIGNAGLRLTTFLRLSQRYFDLGATAVAHNIANEAVAAAQDLPNEPRARVFAEAAIARAYLGDVKRAARDLSIAGETTAQNQVMAALVTHLIFANEPYRASQFIDGLEDPVESVPLDLLLISQLLGDGRNPLLLQRLAHAETQILEMEGTEARALLQSRLARLQVRVGDPDSATTNFTAAMEAARVARTEASDLLLASIAVDQAFALRLEEATGTAGRIRQALIAEQMVTFLASIAEVQASGGLTDAAYPVEPEAELAASEVALLTR